MSEVRPPLSAPLPTEEKAAGGADNKGGRRGGAEKSSAPRGRLRPLVLARLVAGASVHAISRDLGAHRSTVQHHRDALLASGAIQISGGKVRPGPAYAVERGADSDRAPPANPTAPWLATDGSRTFEILRAPATHPSTLPGFLGTALVGRGAPEKKRRDHRVMWNHVGHSFDLVLMESPGAVGHGWSLQLKKVRPAPRLAGIQNADEDVETAWDRFTSAAVQAWGQAANVAVSPVARRSRPVSLALAGILDPAVKFRSQDADADGTPDPGTLEVRTAALKAFVETGPEIQAATGQRLEALETRVIGLEALVAKEATIAERIVGVQEHQARAVAATLEAIAPNRTLSPSVQPSSPGVEHQ